MAVSTEQLYELYLAYFGRPPDPPGLEYFTGRPEFASDSAAAAFSASPEARSLYGTRFDFEHINAIYRSLFDRDAEPAGKEYWYAQVVTGRITPAGAALAILQGAQHGDRAIVQNKLQAVQAFLAQLDTLGEIQGYAGDVAARAARNFLKEIDASALSVVNALTKLPALIATLGQALAETAPRALPIPAAPLLAEQGSSDLADDVMNAAEAVTTTLRVALPTTNALAAAGNQVELLLAGAAFRAPKVVTLTAGDIANGYVDFTVAMADLGVDGTQALTATIANATGVSAPSDALAFLLDTAAPDAPTGVTFTPAGGSLVPNTVNGTTTHLEISATIAAGQATGGRAEFYAGSTKVGEDTSIAAGDTTVSWTSSDGTPVPAELQALLSAGGVVSTTLFDAAGNSTASTVGNPTLVYDTVLPATMGKPVLATASDSGAFNSDGITMDTTPTLSGAGAPANATVNLYNGGTLLAQVQAVADGSWSTTLAALADGVYAIDARTTDAAGNESAASPALALTVDTIGPMVATTASTARSATFTLSENLATATVTASMTPQNVTLTGNQVLAQFMGFLLPGEWVKVVGVDKAGNIGPAYTKTYEMI